MKKTFAHEIIERQCGTHSTGLIYNFLLKAGYDANEAEAQFVSYLSGQLPERLLETARLWVAEEQERLPITHAHHDSRELVPA
jgi:hypothetical protein